MATIIISRIKQFNELWNSPDRESNLVQIAAIQRAFAQFISTISPFGSRDIYTINELVQTFDVDKKTLREPFDNAGIEILRKTHLSLMIAFSKKIVEKILNNEPRIELRQNPCLAFERCKAFNLYYIAEADFFLHGPNRQSVELLSFADRAFADLENSYAKLKDSEFACLRKARRKALALSNIIRSKLL